jgi:L-ascorbate metabolism protein UlaG (beta-lactamase superfamily)
MYKKPFIKNGRYYNHANDSIKTRIIELFQSIFYIACHRLTSKGSMRATLGHSNVEHEWRVEPNIPIRSQEPLITWLGHATFLIQVDGINILTDPVFGEISRIAPRIIKAPLSVDKLPPIDVVLISHNHKDHTDQASLIALTKHKPHVFAPLGNKQWLVDYGFSRVTECTWWDAPIFNSRFSSVKLSFLPASHWTSRGLFDVNRTLWGSWMVQAKGHTIYFAGDTAYSEHFKVIGDAFERIDVALLPIGPINPRHLMKLAHVSAEESVQALLDLKAHHFIPMHWGTFMFGTDAFLDPIHALYKAWDVSRAALHHQTLHVVKFGQTKNFSLLNRSAVDAATAEQTL